jgi:1,4-alpha-glucan branching enzyme
MGSELAVESEWTHDHELPWNLLTDPGHRGVHDWVAHLNRMHRDEPALHEVDFAPEGFEWIDAADAASSVLAFLRWPADRDADRPVLVVANLTPVPRHPYRVGVPRAGRWSELANSDASHYSGSGWGNLGSVEASATRAHGRRHSLELALPPLSIIFLAPG